MPDPLPPRQVSEQGHVERSSQFWSSRLTTAYTHLRKNHTEGNCALPSMYTVSTSLCLQQARNVPATSAKSRNNRSPSYRPVQIWELLKQLGTKRPSPPVLPVPVLKRVDALAALVTQFAIVSSKTKQSLPGPSSTTAF